MISCNNVVFFQNKKYKLNYVKRISFNNYNLIETYIPSQTQKKKKQKGMST